MVNAAFPENRDQSLSQPVATQARYALLTAAKNEEAYIEEAIQSVLRQTIRPAIWVIVDDGSTDATWHILRRFSTQHRFIRPLQTATNAPRDFGSKDRAINMAYMEARRADFDYVGVQDADIAPERADYYECMLREFRTNPSLGITGGYIYERDAGVWKCRKSNSSDSVAGGSQLFRRVCFEKNNGFTPLSLGGEDWLAQLDAKIDGWKVYACPDYKVFHYRSTSTASGRWRGLYKLGQMDASFGSDFLFEILKCARRIRVRPYVVGSLVRFWGYAWWKISGRQPILDAKRVAHLRREQKDKVRAIWNRSRSSSSAAKH